MFARVYRHGACTTWQSSPHLNKRLFTLDIAPIMTQARCAKSIDRVVHVVQVYIPAMTHPLDSPTPHSHYCNASPLSADLCQRSVRSDLSQSCSLSQSRLRNSTRTSVPLDLLLGHWERLLIITGPNRLHRWTQVLLPLTGLHVDLQKLLTFASKSKLR
jgi:hypothetical protein